MPHAAPVALSLLDPHSLLSSAGALAIFLVLFAETGLLIGFFLPGDSLLFTAGVLCATSANSAGHLSLATVLPAAAAGALAGAQAGFVIGRQAGHVLERPGRPRLTAAVRRAHDAIDRYGVRRAIVLARFIPVVRTVINPVAGAAGIPAGTFACWQVIGGLIWSVGVTLAGYALGSRISNIDHYLLPVIAVIVALSLIPVLIEILRRRGGRSRRPAGQPGEPDGGGPDGGGPDGGPDGEPAPSEASMIHQLSYLQAIVIGLIQGLTELFPISSLGHTVLIPSWLGGSWAALVREESRPESPYLAFIVGLHLATALVLIAYYWREWLRLIRGLVTSLISRRIQTPDQRLAWLIVIATIPVGVAGLALEHTFRVLFARPEAAALFLMVNGGILVLGERYRRRAGPAAAPGGDAAATAAGPAGTTAPANPVSAETAGAAAATVSAPSAETAGAAAAASASPASPVAPGPAISPAHGDNSKTRAAAVGASAGLPPSYNGTRPGPGEPAAPPPSSSPQAGPGHTPIDGAAERRLAELGWRSALWIGAAQILALFAGISREGVTMAGGLVRGLSHEDAMRFSFLLSTPVILAAGALKIPDLTGPLGAGIRGQVIVGSVAAAATSLFAIVFLSRYFRTRTLTPFAIYCLVAGLISLIRFI